MLSRKPKPSALPERRRVRRRPMRAWQKMHMQAESLESARQNFESSGKGAGAVLMREAMRSALAKQAVMRRLVLDPKFEIENDARFNERLFDFLRSRRAKKPFSFAIIDLDYFKQLNDAQGHEAGDNAISFLAEKLAGTIKLRGGFAGRFGGDEFRIVVPANSSVLKRLLDSVLAEMKARGLTFSAGISDSRNPRLSNRALRNHKDIIQRRVELLSKLADQALYKSKKAGRARVSVL